MTDEKKTHKCFTCGKMFQHKEHVYGKWIPTYQIEVCIDCWNDNWDGWTPRLGDKIIEHLKEKGLPVPPMNKKEFLPRN